VKRKYQILISLAVIFTMSLFGHGIRLSHAGVVSSKELIARAKEFNGKKVIYRGEAVTAIMERGAYAWINLNDGSNAIGIWCKSQSLGPVKFLGDYKHKGDMVEVTGKFNRACPMHQGDMDIHATDVKIISHGRRVDEVIDKKRNRVSVAIFALIFVSVFVFRKRV
jgi:aspartyl/asparaginyl-tRNA synthetase